LDRSAIMTLAAPRFNEKVACGISQGHIFMAWACPPFSAYLSAVQPALVLRFESAEGVNQFAVEFREQSRGKWMEVERLGGFCLLLKREVLTRIGSLDPWTDLISPLRSRDADKPVDPPPTRSPSSADCRLLACRRSVQGPQPEAARARRSRTDTQSARRTEGRLLATAGTHSTLARSILSFRPKRGNVPMIMGRRRVKKAGCRDGATGLGDGRGRLNG
jgi:hypothetical protein